MNQPASGRAPAPSDNGEAILAAALAEFGERGFKGATIKGIAARAGLSPALVYWYYRDKEDLFRAVMTRISDRLVTAPGFSPNSGEEPAVVLTRLVGAYLSMVQQPEIASFLQLAVSEARRFPETTEALRTAGPGRLLERLTAYLEAQTAAGRLSIEHPALAARMFMGALAASVLAVKFLGLPPTGAERPDVLAPLVLRMLGVAAPDGVALDSLRASSKE